MKWLIKIVKMQLRHLRQQHPNQSQEQTQNQELHYEKNCKRQMSHFLIDIYIVYAFLNRLSTT